MPEKAGLLSTKAWLQSQLENVVPSFVSLSTMADSNSCALVISLRKEKRVVALPREKGTKAVILKFLTIRRI